MGLFDKKYCSICGSQIKLLGNRKLEDGNCCKDCANKLSPFFSERRHSTVESIKEQLAYREANKAEVEKFMTDNQKKISEIRIRIMTCDSLKEWPNVKNWAIAAANNIRSNLIDTDYDYGHEYGDYLVKDITKMIFRKEEELIRKTFKN